jgi:hypothetical protein
MSFAELVDASTAVVHGRVSEVRGQWTADRHGIESLLVVDAIAYMKGALGERVIVRVPGGQVGSFVNIIPGAPRFDQGDRVVLFLTATGPSIPIVTGTTQGVFRVSSDARTGGLMVTPPVIDAGPGPARIVRGDLDRRPLSIEAFAAAVQGARVSR